MKKQIVMLMLCTISGLSLNAKDCKIVSSPSQNINDIRGTDSVSLSISHVYYDENKKMQIKSYSDAYQDFRKQSLDYIKEDCKKYKMTKIYNFKVNSIIDKNYYHFNSSWDFN